jgi:hypothetical protein
MPPCTCKLFWLEQLHGHATIKLVLESKQNPISAPTDFMVCITGRLKFAVQAAKLVATGVLEFWLLKMISNDSNGTTDAD